MYKIFIILLLLFGSFNSLLAQGIYQGGLLEKYEQEIKDFSKNPDYKVVTEEELIKRQDEAKKFLDDPNNQTITLTPKEEEQLNNAIQRSNSESIIRAMYKKLTGSK